MARASKDTTLDRAIALLDRIPLIDGHNDMPYVVHADQTARGDISVFDLGRVHQDYDTDIPRLREGRVAAQFWASFIPSLSPHPGRRVMEVMDVTLQAQERYPDVFLPARRAADVARAKRAGKIASFITVEGGAGLENSLAPLRVWHAAGMRLMTLCHNETLDWVDSATDAPRHGGLTPFGRQVVLELNRLGVIVDLAHAADTVMHQVLDISRAPVLFSHSNARALCDHPRNVPDDVLARVKGLGAVVMATFVPTFINQATRDWFKPMQDRYGKAAETPDGDLAAKPTPSPGTRPRATLEQYCNHLEYLVQKTGTAHVGIGSDFYGGPVPDGLENVGCFPRLFAQLMRRGWSDPPLAALASGNVLRVLRTVERVGAQLRKSETARVGRIEDFDGRAKPARA